MFRITFLFIRPLMNGIRQWNKSEVNYEAESGIYYDRSAESGYYWNAGRNGRGNS